MCSRRTALGGAGESRGMGASEDTASIPHGPPSQKTISHELSECGARAEQR